MKYEDVRNSDMIEHTILGMKGIVINKTPDCVWYQDISSTSVSTIDVDEMDKWRVLENAK